MVKVPVSDLQAATEFYTECLGMRAGTRFNDHEWIVESGTDEGANVVLFCDPDRALGSFDFGPGWLLIRMPDRPSLVADLRAAGARVEREPIDLPEHNVRLLIANDPFGNILEIVTPLS